jgi:hypothetical protein
VINDLWLVTVRALTAYLVAVAIILGVATGLRLTRAKFNPDAIAQVRQ